MLCMCMFIFLSKLVMAYCTVHTLHNCNRNHFVVLLGILLLDVLFFLFPNQIHIVKPVRGHLKSVITAAATKSKNGKYFPMDYKIYNNYTICLVLTVLCTRCYHRPLCAALVLAVCGPVQSFSAH